jgi:hypothetical protein
MDGDVLTEIVNSINGLQSTMLRLLNEDTTHRDLISEIGAQQAALLRAATERRMALERLDIEEPNGTTRIAISNNRLIPPAIVGGQTLGNRKGEGDGPAALIFYDDEGSECGGLAFGGKRNTDGSYASDGSLTFDAYQQDQVIGVQHSDLNGQRFAGFRVWDRPSLLMPEWLTRMQALMDLPECEEKQTALQDFHGSQQVEAQRIFIGRYEGDAMCNLCDSRGRIRLRLIVAADGATRIEFLDEGGAVIKTIGVGTD